MGLVQKAFSDIITFSRSSNATRVGPTGLVEYAPHNLILQSQTFDNASWTKTRASITANSTSAPDGTVTAETLVEDSTASNTHLIQQDFSTVSGTTYTQSYFVKASTRTWCAIYGGGLAFSTAPFAFFNLSTGVLGSTGNGALSAAITLVGNGWYRISITVLATTGSTANLALRLATGNNTSSYTGDGTSGIYIWGAQLSVGPYPLDYTPTTSAAVYGPRFDFDPVTLAARGLLVEEQRVNNFTYSEDFSNAIWGTASNVTITANSAASPDGTTTADTMTEVATTATHRIEYITSGTSVATQYTVSFYVKVASGSPWFRLTLTDNLGNHQISAWFDLTNGVNGSTSVVGSGVIASRSITAVGNGWYRCVMTGTVTGGTGVVYSYTGLANADLAVSYLGSTSRAVYLWGAQLEAGSFATSYVPTLASTVTRSADVASVNTLSPWVNQTEGTLFVEVGPKSNWALGNRMACLAKADGSDRTTDIYYNGTYISLFSSGGATVNNAAPGVGAVKAAAAYKLNDYALSVNGTAATTDPSATVPTADILGIGVFYGASTTYLNGHIRRLAYYPRRLLDAELQALTA